MPIQFHLDENMPRAVADGLRRRGVDVSTSVEADLVGATDERQLNYACRHGRTIVTRDADMLRLNAAGIEHTGIVFWTQRRTVGQLIAALDLLNAERTTEVMMGQVVFL